MTAEPTVGSSFSSKTELIKLEGAPSNTKVKLQIWDTAGSEQFRSLAPIYYKNASAVIIVYDCTS